MRILFVKQSLAWPRSSGHDVHTFHLMKACTELGHEVALATVQEPRAEAIEGLPLVARARLGEITGVDPSSLVYTKYQERFRAYWGVERRFAAALRQLTLDVQPQAVVIAGLEALGYFPGVPESCVRVWYAADEWVRHHLSLVQWRDRASWHHVRPALVKGLYERVYAPLMDRAWVVSAPEQTAMRRYAGVRQVDIVPNGVDAQHFAPRADADLPRSAVFWGRLDFEPNIQGLEWFVATVWPAVRARVPDARLTVIGFNPTNAVDVLCRTPGIELLANLEDLRAEVARREVVTLPFVTGGGIKNKLLEAAAMGKPIVCTPRGAEGLHNVGTGVLRRADSPAEWVAALEALWGSSELRRQQGNDARAWVMAEHSWTHAAKAAVAGIEESLRARGHA